MTAAEARRDAARAAVDRLEAEAARYRILAPIDGIVIARHADPGEIVAPAAPLLTIADLSRLLVEAEVDEFDIPHVAADAPATVSAEGYPGPGWRGRVQEIADAVMPRQTRPEDPGRPADTRVLLVRIAFLEKTPLKLGQRVEVEIAQTDVRRRGVRTASRRGRIRLDGTPGFGCGPLPLVPHLGMVAGQFTPLPEGPFGETGRSRNRAGGPSAAVKRFHPGVVLGPLHAVGTPPIEPPDPHDQGPEDDQQHELADRHPPTTAP